MIINKFMGHILLGAVLVVLVTSCSPSTGRKTLGRYSSANKRERTSGRSYEEKKYSYHSKKEVSYPFSEKNIKRDEIVLSAIKYTGREYKSGGKSPETGFDCSGFTSYIFSQNGIPIAASSDQQSKQGVQKSKNSLLPGDLVFFGSEERISHVGIVASNKADDLEIVHSTTSEGVKIDNINHSEYWKSRFLFGVDVISK